MSKSRLPEPPFGPERRYRGLPVPYTTRWPIGSDRPDFTSIDSNRVAYVLRLELCAICAQPFNGRKRVWIGGLHEPLDDGVWFADPPMHEGCARYAAKVCPFLSHGLRRLDAPEGALPDTGDCALYIGRGVRTARAHLTRPVRFIRTERIVR